MSLISSSGEVYPPVQRSSFIGKTLGLLQTFVGNSKQDFLQQFNMALRSPTIQLPVAAWNPLTASSKRSSRSGWSKGLLTRSLWIFNGSGT